MHDTRSPTRSRSSSPTRPPRRLNLGLISSSLPAAGDEPHSLPPVSLLKPESKRAGAAAWGWGAEVWWARGGRSASSGCAPSAAPWACTSWRWRGRRRTARGRWPRASRPSTALAALPERTCDLRRRVKDSRIS